MDALEILPPFGRLDDIKEMKKKIKNHGKQEHLEQDTPFYHHRTHRHRHHLRGDFVHGHLTLYIYDEHTQRHQKQQPAQHPPLPQPMAGHGGRADRPQLRTVPEYGLRIPGCLQTAAILLAALPQGRKALYRAHHHQPVGTAGRQQRHRKLHPLRTSHRRLGRTGNPLPSRQPVGIRTAGTTAHRHDLRGVRHRYQPGR